MNKLKEKLAKGKIVLGTWCEIPSPEFINVLATAGLDFVIIDMEHGAMDFATTGEMTMAAQVEKCSVLIRVARNDESDILRALELAPEGIVVPHIETVQDSKKAIQFTKYPPVGMRSLNPFTRAGSYHTTPTYTTSQNENNIVSLIVEGKKGIANIEKILDKNIDVIYIGTYDISTVLGVPGEIKHKKVLNTLETLVKKIRKQGKIAACMFHDEEELAYFKRIGIQMICYKVDTAVVYDSFSKIKRSIA